MKYFLFILVILLSLSSFGQDKKEVKCWMLISDSTSRLNIDINHSVMVMPAAPAIQIRGYEITDNGITTYLDEKRKPLNKIFLVWMVKYIDWEPHKK